MSYISDLTNLAKRVNLAKHDIAQLSSTKKNQLLHAIASALLENSAQIIAANELDIAQARIDGISDTMIDRLRLDEARIKAVSDGVLKVAALHDPIGEVTDGCTLENGLEVIKKRVPLGVIGIIYESRPNVTVDAAVLCLKSSNAVILRGGKEAIRSNICLGKLMRNVIANEGLNPDILAVVEDTSRENATAMMQLNGYIDVLIPRGSAGLISAVVKNATVPVIETGSGNCHIYIDASADLEMGASIVNNAKVSRPSVCNSCETILVHHAVAAEFLPKVKALLDTSNVVLLGCQETIKVLGSCVLPATEEDYATEFNDYKLAVKVVNGINDAISHIRQFTTYHSEAIITESLKDANQFTAQIDAAAVYVNASTRFTDGEVFGLGAEIGISTQKLHARGPMGLKELTSIKYIITGNGQIR